MYRDTPRMAVIGKLLTAKTERSEKITSRCVLCWSGAEDIEHLFFTLHKIRLEVPAA